jgi:hypothetical protein
MTPPRRRQDDGASEACEVAELACSEGEARIASVLTGVGVGKRGKQQSARMRAHMEAVGDQGDRAKQQAADNLDGHHGSTEPDHGPRFTFAFLMSLVKEHVAMKGRVNAAVSLDHGGPHFR